MLDRRHHFRRRTLLEGRLEVEKLNGWVVACSVRNLSEGGARVTIPGEVVVPQHLQLAVSDQPPRPARLVWYRDGQAGFALVDASAREQPDAPAPSPDAMAALPNDRLAARLAAIVARAPSTHFTRP